jgi:sterol desaturase/sphingolipid hydroxylase (fatty acid hydroxylase superfamily)
MMTSNVDARLGPLQGHLSIGRVHHLHHVNCGTEGDCNFGLLLTIWDRLLGTFNPDPPRPITSKDIGVDELPNFPRLQQRRQRQMGHSCALEAKPALSASQQLKAVDFDRMAV